MAIQGLKAKFIEPKPKVEIQPKPKPKASPQQTEKFQAPVAQANSKPGEVAFGAAVKKATLNQTLDTGFQAAGAKAATTDPIDYFEVDKKADEIIENNTKDGLFGSSLDTDGVGQELAEIAKNDPQEARAVTDNILDKIKDKDRDEVAQSLTDSLSAEELRELAKDDDGREMLDQLKGHLLDGSVHKDEKVTAERINTAIKSADLENNADFQALDPTVQSEVISQIEKNETDATAVDNIIDLATSSEFTSLPVNTQQAILTTLDNHASDTTFVEGIKNNAGKADFIALNETQQAQVISNLDKIAQTESYQGKDGGLFGIGGRNVSDEAKAYLLDNLGDTAILAASDPTNTTINNTLNQIISGDIKVEAYSEPAKDGRITFGYNNGNGTLYMNMHADANNPAYGKHKFTDTLVHELNHQLNQGAPHGTPDQFLNEYRAFYTGYDAIGNTMDGQQLDDIVDNLVNGYDAINDLYNSDDDFKKFIDETRKGFNETPPVLLNPEEMRQALLDAGFDSDYLNTTGNIDNH